MKDIYQKVREGHRFDFLERGFQIFEFSFSKETEASYWRRGDLPSINFENLEEE